MNFGSGMVKEDCGFRHFLRACDCSTLSSRLLRKTARLRCASLLPSLLWCAWRLWPPRMWTCMAMPCGAMLQQRCSRFSQEIWLWVSVCAPCSGRLMSPRSRLFMRCSSLTLHLLLVWRLRLLHLAVRAQARHAGCRLGGCARRFRCACACGFQTREQENVCDCHVRIAGDWRCHCPLRVLCNVRDVEI